ncbi:ATP-binding protein [Tropicibacter sp. S64]|uniref:ATP-binding protein n=1 Tax=Tropicibacter sp. S64 TaxID=3415122 RepID=UPI003C7B0076
MQPVSSQDGNALNYVLRSRPDAVRETLMRVRSDMLGLGVGPEDFGLCEIVLAEALNNIVEHAYSEAADGEIRLSLSVDARTLVARIEDFGLGMPGGGLPEGGLGSLDVAVNDLPEGGFGWFMIHSMTDTLCYRRKNGVNILDFTIPFPAQP